MLAATRLCLLATCGLVVSGCASLSDIPPETLEVAKCAVEALRELPDTKDVGISVAKQYQNPEPIVEFEYRDPSGHNRFGSFKITHQYDAGVGNYVYYYTNLGDQTHSVSLPENAAPILETQCHVEELVLLITYQTSRTTRNGVSDVFRLLNQ